ncbi:hypothetical protein EYF80_009525 [Liparis tanakae]|uniref:Uncharacterized protein n=1 Tax=Liparis tanakae TaxID=230148 RepID=A0A4Z2IQC9_9TELE|nr:hypothetical protein EYF80_009525 [Liparis tanakae]
MGAQIRGSGHSDVSTEMRVILYPEMPVSVEKALQVQLLIHLWPRSRGSERIAAAARKLRDGCMLKDLSRLRPKWLFPPRRTESSMRLLETDGPKFCQHENASAGES